MNLCIGQPLYTPAWSGLPLGRFAPPGHAIDLPVAAAQDTLFVWKDGASPAHVRDGRDSHHYRRHRGVMDIMGVDQEAFISHDHPESPGECLLVAFPTELRDALGHGGRGRESAGFRSRFGFSDPHLLELAHALERQCLDGEPWGKLYTESLSNALTAYVAHRYSAAAPWRHGPPARTVKGRLSAVQQARLHRYIDEHLSTDVGLQDLAALVGLSQQHFIRVFRQAFSVSPYQYVIGMRVERAKQMLRSDRQSLSEVALACGFADQSHFSTCFARRTGMSPGRFRRA